MAGDLRSILHAAARVPPPLFKYSPAPTRHRLHPGLMLLASGHEGVAGEHAVLLFDSVTPEQFSVWTTEFFGAGQPFSVTVEVGIAEPVEAALQRQGWQLVEEEMGLHVHVSRLIGIYTSPHRLIAYADGNHYQLVSLSFEAEVVSGELRLSDETTEFGYFAPAEIESLDLMEHHRERIHDALAGQAAAFIR